MNYKHLDEIEGDLLERMKTNNLDGITRIKILRELQMENK